eukprot:tig00020734_g13567.t1
MPRFVFVKKQVVQAPQYGVEPISLTVGRPQVRSGSVLNNGGGTYGFRLNWGAVTNAVKYKVYRATSLNGTWTLVNTVNAPTLTYTDTPFNFGELRLYRVAAVREQGSSSTGSDGKAPPTTYAQSLLYTHEGTTSNYILFQGLSGFNPQIEAYTTLTTATAQTYGDFIAGAAPRGRHRGRVEYEKSDPLPVWTTPNAPTNVTTTAPDDIEQPVSLSWTAPTGATGYKIYRDGAYLADSATNSYSDATTIWGTGYEYQVSATNSGGEGPKSIVAYVTTDPAAPTELTATPTAGAAQPVVLAWSAPATGVTVSYNIYRDGVFLANDVSSPYSDATTAFGTTAFGTTYTYTVKGVNQIGEEGPASSSAFATTIDSFMDSATISTATKNALRWNYRRLVR